LAFCTDPSCNPSAGTFTDLIIFNLGSATVKGIEVDMAIKPLQDLTLSLGYSRQDTEYDNGVLPQPENPNNPIGNANPIDFSGGKSLKGESFAGVPKTTINVEATYEMSFVPEDIAKAALSVNYYYRDKTPGQSVQGVYETPSFRVWGARLALNDLYRSPFSLALWAKNLTNEKYKLSCSDNLESIGYASCKWGEPRTYGLAATYRF